MGKGRLREMESKGEKIRDGEEQRVRYYLGCQLNQVA
jgi:hypothetical protein